MRMPLALQKPFYISFMGFIAALLNFMVTEISALQCEDATCSDDDDYCCNSNLQSQPACCSSKVIYLWSMKGLGIGVLLVFGSVFICLIRRCWTQIHRKTGDSQIRSSEEATDLPPDYDSLKNLSVFNSPPDYHNLFPIIISTPSSKEKINGSHTSNCSQELPSYNTLTIETSVSLPTFSISTISSCVDASRTEANPV